jgi:DNA-directed RNA polymerase specialized sigma24 family protein
MTDDGLRKLLALLSADPERAAELYLHLQGKLIRYFSWNLCSTPEEFADKVLDRVARRVSEGVQIESPVSYVLGVARRVLLEAKPQELFLPLEGDFADVAEHRNEADLDCLDQCLEEFPPESRAMLLEYYSANSRERIQVRQSMADRMGVSLNALRNRCLRLRRGLEGCLERCRKAKGEGPGVQG